MKTLLIIIINSYLIVESVNSQSAWDSIKDGINSVSKSVVGSACLITVSPKITKECLNDFDEEVNSRPKEDRDTKVLCCAFLALQDCTLKIAKEECGEDGKSVANTFLSNINRGITSDECIDYGFISCITIMQMLIAGAIVLAVLFLLSCICCCCCRSGKRGGRIV